MPLTHPARKHTVHPVDRPTPVPNAQTPKCFTASSSASSSKPSTKPFTAEEDATILRLVEEQGGNKNWKEVHKKFHEVHGYSQSQICQRWYTLNRKKG
ncbi:hypothetical protein HK097_008871 [Rhizophlyctis rosea]|uniref:Myb-like domain-containing protein n=1 Tax=Rhizophlyctis rosea TaxID=64517 RepID=A0AAD5SPS7_9FUNG|nr:hypothetical protein HK097_008871 [Rhizophlyctis rosea]